MDERIFTRIKSGSILLFHNDAEHTWTALPALLEKLKSQGYKPVTVSELVDENMEINANPSE
jgi:peptidoglycan/xylan/chitin deacetylase (PgdA/CDA1 family)